LYSLLTKCPRKKDEKKKKRKTIRHTHINADMILSEYERAIEPQRFVYTAGRLYHKYGHGPQDPLGLRGGSCLHLIPQQKTHTHT